jgi:hypothetical protein
MLIQQPISGTGSAEGTELLAGPGRRGVARSCHVLYAGPMPIRKTASGGRVTGVEVHEAGGDNITMQSSDFLPPKTAGRGWSGKDEAELEREIVQSPEGSGAATGRADMG